MILIGWFCKVIEIYLITFQCNWPHVCFRHIGNGLVPAPVCYLFRKSSAIEAHNCCTIIDCQLLGFADLWWLWATYKEMTSWKEIRSSATVIFSKNTILSEKCCTLLSIQLVNMIKEANKFGTNGYQHHASEKTLLYETIYIICLATIVVNWSRRNYKLSSA